MLEVLTRLVGLSVDDVTTITDMRAVDDMIEKEIRGLKFLFFPDTIHDPVYAVWRLREAKVLEDGCFIAILGVDDPSYTEWSDLVKTYGGARFGKIFLTQYKANRDPGVLPSQKGMYMG